MRDRRTSFGYRDPGVPGLPDPEHRAASDGWATSRSARWGDPGRSSRHRPPAGRRRSGGRRSQAACRRGWDGRCGSCRDPSAPRSGPGAALRAGPCAACGARRQRWRGPKPVRSGASGHSRRCAAPAVGAGCVGLLLEVRADDDARVALDAAHDSGDGQAGCDRGGGVRRGGKSGGSHGEEGTSPVPEDVPRWGYFPKCALIAPRSLDMPPAISGAATDRRATIEGGAYPGAATRPGVTSRRPRRRDRSRRSR